MIKFRMAKINVNQFAILTDIAPNEGLSYSVELGFKGAINAQRVACSYLVEFAHNGTAILKLDILCEFDIRPEDWNNRIKDNTLTITKDELGYFANQTVGVARGVMFCKTEGTPFNHFIIPPINLVELIKEDFTMSLAED